METALSPEAVVALFVEQGARCQKPAQELAGKLDDVRGLIFDWDGVFNDGKKGGDLVSGFSEADSMGTNLLRFGLWRPRQKLPICALITGENNAAALEFAKREHFDAVYSAVRDKRLALEHLCSQHRIKSGQVACIFDDVNDLAMAHLCGLRFMVRRAASSLLTAYAADGGHCDYITASTGGGHAVREIAEFMLGLMARFDEVVQSRVAFDSTYVQYFSRRQRVATCYYRQESERIVAVNEGRQ